MLLSFVPKIQDGRLDEIFCDFSNWLDLHEFGTHGPLGEQVSSVAQSE